MKTKRNIVVALIIAIGFIWPAMLFPLCTSSVCSSPSEAEKKAECIKNFDIKRIDLKGPHAAPFVSMLKEYLICRAAVLDNINECSRFNDPSAVKDCRGLFQAYQSFYGRLLSKNRVSQDILNACIKNGGPSDYCGNYANALLTGDTTFCDTTSSLDKKRVNECKQCVSGDVRSGNDKALYIRAVRMKDETVCTSITNNDLEIMCRGFITGNERVCTDNEGYRSFREYYCQSVSRK